MNEKPNECQIKNKNRNRHFVKSLLFENKNNKQIIVKNSIWMLIGEFFAKLLTFGITIRIARHFGSAQFGVLNYVISFTALFILFIDFGLGNLMHREVSKSSKIQNIFFSNAIYIKIFMTILAGLALFGFMRLGGLNGIMNNTIGDQTINNSLWTIMIVYFLYGSVSNLNDFIRSFFRPKQEMQHESILKVLAGIFLVLFCSTAIIVYDTLLSVVVAFFLASIVNFVITWLYSRKKLGINISRPNIKVIRNILWLSIPFVLGILATYFYSEINIIFLEKYVSKSDIGIFSAAYRIILYFYIVYNIISVSVLKQMIDKINIKKITTEVTRNIQLKRFVNKYSLFSIIISVIIIILTFVFGDFAINVLYGQEYQGASIVLKILSLLLLFKSLSFVYGTGLTAISKEYTRLYIRILVAVVCIVSNIIFTPKFGYLGTVLSICIAEFVLMISNKIFFEKLYLKNSF